MHTRGILTMKQIRGPRIVIYIKGWAGNVCGSAEHKLGFITEATIWAVESEHDLVSGLERSV